jgi:hypothetical protein
LASLSMLSSSGHLTPRSWLTNRIMEDYGITFCTSSLLACESAYDGSACFFYSVTSPFGALVRFSLDPLGSLANALDNIRGVIKRLTSVTVTGIVRPRFHSSHLHLLIVLVSLK